MEKKMIMVVDDEEALRELLKAIMEEEGYEVVTAEDGNDCLQKLKTARPELILLDMMMPGMSGREVCERIRKDPKIKDLKIAFLTVARFSEAGKGTLKEMKVLDYITKPFDNKDLIKKVKKMIG